MSNERASPGPWRFEAGPAYESDSIRDANGDAVVMAHVVDYECPHLHMSAADAALIADAWQLPQLREDNRAMLELLREEFTPERNGSPPCRTRYFTYDPVCGECIGCRAFALLAKHGRAI